MKSREDLVMSGSDSSDPFQNAPFKKPGEFCQWSLLVCSLCFLYLSFEKGILLACDQEYCLMQRISISYMNVINPNCM